MSERGGIDPSKIRSPMQLAAAWFAALVLLVGEFLYFSLNTKQDYLAYGSAIFAALMICGWSAAVYRLQTKHRGKLMDDEHIIKAIAEYGNLKQLSAEIEREKLQDITKSVCLNINSENV